MRKPVLALIGVVVAGFVAWWVFLRSPSRSEPKPVARTEVKTPTGARVAEASADQAGPAIVLIDDDPRGTLRLEGQVIDADDHPVGGATVVINSNPPRTTTSEADGGFAF